MFLFFLLVFILFAKVVGRDVGLIMECCGVYFGVLIRFLLVHFIGNLGGLWCGCVV